MRLSTILRTALEITQRRRDLWRFGFLIALLGSPMLMNTFMLPPLSGHYLQTTSPQAWRTSGWQPPSFWLELMRRTTPREARVLTLSLMGAALLMFAVFYAFSVRGKAALLRGLLADVNGEMATARELWDEARRFFWRLVFFPLPAVLIFGVAMSGLSLFFGALSLRGGTVVGFLLLVPFLIASLGGAWLLSIYFRLGDGAVALEDLPYWDAISRPWPLWKPHFWWVLLVAFVLSLVQWVVDTVLFYIASAAMLGLNWLLAIGPSGMVTWFAAHPVVLFLAAFLLMLAGKLMLAVALTPVMVFITVSWGLLYLGLLERWPVTHQGSPAAAPPSTPLPHA